MFLFMPLVVRAVVFVQVVVTVVHAAEIPGASRSTLELVERSRAATLGAGREVVFRPPPDLVVFACVRFP